MGFDSHVKEKEPETALEEYEVENIYTWAQAAGMDTGVVSTARITHATPAAAYARTFDRDYECDTFYEYDVPMEDVPLRYRDIAQQLVNPFYHSPSPAVFPRPSAFQVNEAPGNKIKVILGGGYAPFFPAEMEEELDQGVI